MSTVRNLGDSGQRPSQAGQELLCFRCGHKWVQATEVPPEHCPNCHSPNWDRPPQGYAM